MKSTTATGSILLVPFDEEVISVANIQAQLSGQIFYIEAELSLANEDQCFCMLACSKCKQLFSRYNVRREIYCPSPTCRRSTQLVPRCHFEVIIKDNNGSTTAIIADEVAEKMLRLTLKEMYEVCFVKKETLSLQKNIQNQLKGKIFKIQMKRLFTKNMDTMPKLCILSYWEKVVIHKSPSSTKIDVSETRKRSIDHLDLEEKEYQNEINKCNPSSQKHATEVKTPPFKKH